MSRLRLVKGNTFYTKNEIRAYRYDGTEIEDFSLTQCKNIKVIANKVHSREIINNYNILDDHNIRILWVGSKLLLGPYRLEITGKYNETDFRYFSEDPIFDIVNSADDLEIPADSIIESDYYIINGSKLYIDLPNITIQGILSDWNETNSSSPYYIKNKPTALSEFTNNVGFITRYDLPQTDLSKYAKIENLATVATTGNYNDLKGKPIIPDVSDYVTEQYVIDKIELSKITEDIVSGWGFTKNTGTYSKPNGGIPKSDLEDDVQTSLGKADTALQSFTETDPTVPAWAKAVNKPSYTASEVGALPDTTVIPDSVSDLTQDVNYAGASSVGGTANKAASIPFGEVDSTSTATAFTATVDGITELKDGVCVYLMNGVVTSASGFTLNINNLGAKPCYSNLSAASRDTTIFNVAYTMLFVYNSTRVSGGCWDCFRGYDSNTNTLGYQLRTNSSTLPAKFKTYRYRLLFTSPDGTHFVAANASTSTSADTAKTPTTEKIDPFGPIVYYGYTTAINANANFGVSYLWTQYTLNIGYSFNNTGAAASLTFPAPIYIKATPQSDGSAIIDATTPYVQTLPSTDDGKIYIFLGLAYSATGVELSTEHPVYYYKSGSIRLWSNAAETDISGKANTADLANVAFSGNYNDLSNKPTIPAAPGTLNTTSTTGQSINASESLSGNITLHKISKTGSYNDLIGTPTITSIEPSGSSHLTDAPVWENMINAVPVYSTTGLYGGNNTTSDNYNDVTYYWDTAPTSGSTKAVTSGGVYTALLNNVNSTSVSSIVTLTDAQYEALSTKDSSTLYIITSS